MKYEILGHISNKLLVVAYLNKDNDYYYKANTDRGTTYLLPNVHIVSSIPVDTAGVLHDSLELTSSHLKVINEYLAADKEVYISNLYCDELKRLLEYDKFLGNSVATSRNTKTELILNRTVLLHNSKLIDYLDYLYSKYEYLVTIGDFQKLVPEEKLKVCNKNNIDQIINLLGNSSLLVPEISSDDDNLDIVLKIRDVVPTGTTYYLTNAFSGQLSVEPSEIVLCSTRIIRSSKWLNQYQSIIDDTTVRLDSVMIHPKLDFTSRADPQYPFTNEFSSLFGLKPVRSNFIDMYKDIAKEVESDELTYDEWYIKVKELLRATGDIKD